VASGREIQLSLDRDELLGLMQDSLESLALKLGLPDRLQPPGGRGGPAVAGGAMSVSPHRTHTRYGHQTGYGDPGWPENRHPLRASPACEAPTGAARSPLETYARLAIPRGPCPRAVLRRMVRGVSTRDYADVIDLTRVGFGVEKSSVSRGFVRASAAQVQALAETAVSTACTSR